MLAVSITGWVSLGIGCKSTAQAAPTHKPNNVNTIQAACNMRCMYASLVCVLSICISTIPSLQAAYRGLVTQKLTLGAVLTAFSFSTVKLGRTSMPNILAVKLLGNLRTVVL